MMTITVLLIMMMIIVSDNGDDGCVADNDEYDNCERY